MEHKIGELLNNAGLSGGGRTQDQLTPVIQEATRQIQELVTLTQGTADSLSQNTAALTQAPSTSGSSVGTTLGSAAENLLGSQGPLGGLLGGGLIGDLFSGLSGLFGGGPSQPPPLVPYNAPQSQDFELATGGGQLGDAVYKQSGAPQVSPVTEPALSGLQYMGAASGGSDRSAAQASPQITVQVQAMDSQSFLDRSADIAQAVRQAMLNMHSINDVIGDL